MIPRKMKFKDELRGCTWAITALAILYFGGHIIVWLLR